MHNGIVKKFDSQELYGFIDHQKKDVFFHMSFGGMMASVGGDTPEFVKCDPGRIPKPGDTLLFEYDVGPKGLRCTRWAFFESYQQALNQIDLRVKYQLWERKGRIMSTRLYNPSKAKYVKLWEGTNLSDLRSLFPKDKYPLFSHDYGELSFNIFSKEQNDFIPFDGDPR